MADIDAYFPDYPFPDDPDTYYTALLKKKELFDLKEIPIDEYPKNTKFFNHQEFIARILSWLTPYNGMLIFHDMGTGKTSTALHAAEAIIENHLSGIKDVIILTRGEQGEGVFRRELRGRQFEGKYELRGDEVIKKDRTQSSIINGRVNEYYKFFTFYRFAQYIRNLRLSVSGNSDDIIRREFSNKVFIIDEIQFINDKDTNEEREIGKYDQLNYVLHLVENCKVIMLSGTPMKDVPEEFAPIMNLILPYDKQLPLRDKFLNFYQDYEKNSYKENINKEKEFKRRIAGYVSFLKSESSLAPVFQQRVNYITESVSDKGQITKIENKDLIGSDYIFDSFKLYASYMEEYQTNRYEQTYIDEAMGTDYKDSNTIFPLSSQYANFAYPNEMLPQKGYDQFEVSKTSKHLARYFARELDIDVNDLEMDRIYVELSLMKNKLLNIIGTHGIKYKSAIQEIVNNPNQNVFVYNRFVQGSGCILFGRLLELFGYQQFDPNNVHEGKYYAILSGETISSESQRNKILESFNSPDNAQGKHLQVIIGSEVASTAITLKCLQQIHIITGFWNYTDVAQSIKRGIRIGAYDTLYKLGVDFKIKVFLHTAIIKNKLDNVKDIDLHMYHISEDKDKRIRKLISLIKESAIDCSLNLEINMAGVDFSQECDYRKCAYKCDFIKDDIYKFEESDLDVSTYNLYYSNKETFIAINKIKEVFNGELYMPFDELKMRIKSENDIIVIRALSMIINLKEPIINKYGLVSYLHEDGDIYFLSPYMKSYFWTEYNYNQPVLKIDTTFEDHIEETRLHMTSEIMKILKNNIHDKRKSQELFELLPTHYKRAAIIMAIENHNSDNPLIKFILTHNSAEYSKLPDNKFIYNGKCFDGEWVECHKGEIETIRKKKKQSLESNEHGFFIIANPTARDRNPSDYWIVDVCKRKRAREEAEKLGKKFDARKSSPGMKCSSYNKGMLSSIAYKFGMVPQKLQLMELSEIKRHLERDSVPEYLWPSENSTKEDLMRWGGIYRSTIRDLCSVIYNLFEQKGLIEVTNLTERPQGVEMIDPIPYSKDPRCQGDVLLI